MIVFKLKVFPAVSETFIVSNIVLAARMGLTFKILADKYNGIQTSSQSEMLIKNNIESYIDKKFILPERNEKIFSVLRIILRPTFLFYFFKWGLLYRKFRPSMLLTLYRYRHIRDFSIFNICHAHFNDSIKEIVLLDKIGYLDVSKTSFIITFHGLDAFNVDKSQFRKLYKKIYTENVKVVTVNSDYLKKKILQIGVPEEIIHKIPIGVDFRFFDGKIRTYTPNKKIKLISVGRLINLKGHKYGIYAVKKLVDNGFEIDYVIIGDGTERKFLESEIERLNLNDVVTLTGNQAQYIVKEYLHKSHIFLMTSTFDDITKRREAFGLATIEAQACGLPVVGFDSGGFLETIRNEVTGFAVPDRDVCEMAKKIEYLIKSPENYLKFSENALQYAAKFDHSLTTERYIALYNLLLNK